MKDASNVIIFDNIFSKYQCGFRKGYSAQHCLLVIIQKWEKIVDKFGALLTDLYKALDCIRHDLIIAKLEAYGFQIDALTHSFPMQPFSTL